MENSPMGSMLDNEHELQLNWLFYFFLAVPYDFGESYFSFTPPVPPTTNRIGPDRIGFATALLYWAFMLRALLDHVKIIHTYCQHPRCKII